MLPDSFLTLSKKDRREVDDYYQRLYNYTSDTNIVKLMFDSVKSTESFETYEFKVQYKVRKTEKEKQIKIVKIYPTENILEK